MEITIDECRTCKHAFTTGKDRWYCKKSLADKDDCGEYEMTIEAVNARLHKKLDNAPTVEAIVIPNNSTNGDVTMVVYSEPTANLIKFHMGNVWWNAPYREVKK